MQLVDTHCHIHSADYNLPADEVIDAARTSGVDKLICVGTDEQDSALAVNFVADRPGCWASIGLHPHDAKLGQPAFDKLAGLIGLSKIVAVGECGLDYYYSHSPKDNQLAALRFQLELAQKNELPLIFHVREAFDDFWPVFDDYPKLQGVIHSFTAGEQELAEILKRDLLVGLNGIMTFSKNPQQLAAAKAIPLDKLVLETDSPFLTPSPYRGKVNQPKYVGVVAEFLADLRQEEVAHLSETTSQNAVKLFGLKE